MKYKIISDIHLGVKGDVSNNFKFDEEVFRQYLIKSSTECDAIIMNGDTFELWKILSKQKVILLKREYVIA